MTRTLILFLAALAFAAWAAPAPSDTALQPSKPESHDGRAAPPGKETAKAAKARFEHGHEHHRLCDRSRCYELCDRLENDSGKGLRRLRAAECRADCMEDCD